MQRLTMSKKLASIAAVRAIGAGTAGHAAAEPQI
jgi:hypothetical protein